MLQSASAFNQDIAAWNVLRVSNVALAFDSTTALSDCYKMGMYTAWGTTLQKAYPTWANAAATCASAAASRFVCASLRSTPLPIPVSVEYPEPAMGHTAAVAC